MLDNQHLGLGMMINMLGGNAETVAAFQGSLHKTITALSLDGYDLRFEFADGSNLRLFDDGQSCCESRYMRTDDKLEDYIGGTLDGAEIRDAPEVEDEYGRHEVQFLVIKTSKGQFTMSSHNEHNGYYGGFAIVARND